MVKEFFIEFSCVFLKQELFLFPILRNKFITERSFEPMVMFFELTNLPAIFQAMINELLRDLINTGKVATFIDDVIIETDTEKEHDESVAEVIKRLEKNDLYVKPEKCKWKVQKVRFLGVVIGLEGIKMEEDKVKGVLDWLVPE